MKLNRMASLLALALMTAACGGAAEEDAPAVDETVPAPAPAPAPADTGMMHQMDSTAATTTTAM
jgi:hypothetical protein